VPEFFEGCIGLKDMYNFGIMAQELRNGENRFLSPCDFKELGVAKRSRSFCAISLATALEHHSVN
jgi:hypothetical protein